MFPTNQIATQAKGARLRLFAPLLRRRAEDGDFLGAGLQRGIEALQIGRQNRVDRSSVPDDALRHRCVVGHLPHPLRRHERSRLDDAKTRISQALDQFDLGIGRDDCLLRSAARSAGRLRRS